MRRGIGTAVESDFKLTGEKIDFDHDPPALGGIDERALLRGYLEQILVVVLLIF